MKVINVLEMHKTDREVTGKNGGFKSIRAIIKSDGMGFTITRTTIYKTEKWQRWHYKNHLEACYCLHGSATLKDEKTGKKFDIFPGVLYMLDENDPHLFKAKETTILMCVFNPPLTGKELHQEDGSYEL